MSTTRRILVFSALVAGSLAAAMTSWAFWSASGSGASNATVGTLAKPISVVGSASGSTVHVSWTGVVSPAGGNTALGYWVRRFSGATGTDACGSSKASPLSAPTASCNDTNVVTGTYTYTVTAVFRSWTATSDASSSVTVLPLDHFVVSAPSTSTAGSPFGVTVTAQDTSNNTLSAYTGTIHFTSSDPAATSGSGLPADYTFVGSDSGSRTFTNGVTLKTSGARTVSVNDTAQTSKTGSASVSVAAASATKLGFTTQPGNGMGGSALNPQPVVAIQDTYGNTVTSASTSVSLAIGTNPATGTLSGTTTLATAGGVATFTNVSVNKPGNGYTLTTTNTSSLVNATSTTFNISVGAAAKLAFTTQPGNGTGGSALSTQPVVTVQDAGGNTVTSDTSKVTVAIGTNPSNGTLSGTTQVNAVNGVASFANLAIDKAGNGYTLNATDGLLTSAASNTFNITVGSATKFAVGAPATATAGTSFNGITLTAQDAGGNTVTSYSGGKSITWSAPTSPGGNAPSLPASTVNFISGASTTSLSATMYAAGSSISLSAQQGTITGSATINVTAATASTMQLSNCSVNGVSGSCGSSFSVGNGGMMTATIDIFDAYGNVPTPTNATISLSSSNSVFTVTPSVSVNSSSSPRNRSGQLTVTYPSQGAANTTITATASGFGTLTWTVKK